MELSGRLTSFPIAEILHWSHNDRRTGSLVVRAAGREKHIFFRDGQIVNCTTDDPSEFYGQFLLLSGYLDQQTLYRCLSQCKERHKRLGEVLLEEELMSLADIQRTLRFHLEDVICDIFLWDHGVFFFRSEPLPTEDLLAEPIATLGLALEGSHWVDTVGRIRQRLVDDHVVLERTEAELPADLKPRQRRILDEVDGLRRLEALYGAIHGSFFRFLEACDALLEAGLIAVAHHGRTLHPRQKDAGLDDLLWEVASREQADDRHHLISLGDLEHYVPLWVRPPSDEEKQRMPESVRDFYRRFDGQTPLEALLSADELEWHRQVDLLMLQIGKQALALLPAPLEQLRAEAAERRTTASLPFD